VNALAWIAARLLWLYPTAFRRRFGAEMLIAFRARIGDARRRSGRFFALATTVRALADLVVNGLAERFVRDRGLDRQPVEASATATRRGLTDWLFQDLKIATRRLRREPGFAAMVVLTLAGGIGAATTIFSLVDGVLLRPLPYREADRLLTIWQWSKSKGIEEPPSPANFLDWRDRAVRVDLAAAEPFGLDLTDSGDPVALDTWRVSERFFETLGVTPLLGRVFHPGEHVAGRDRVVILGHALWQTRFGSDRSVVGRSVTLDGVRYEVVGVLPPHIDYPSRRDIFVPKVFSANDRRARLQTYYRVVARLKPGVSVAQARDELAAIAEQIGLALPRTNKDVGVLAVPLFERVTGSVRPILLLMLGAVGCVMAIACANAANLLLARAGARHTEMAVRRALGASRRDLLRFTLAESVVLTAVAAGVAILASRWAIAAVIRIAPATLPRVEEVELNLGVLGFAIALAGATAVICGLAPAAQLWQPSIEHALRAGGRSSTSGGTRFRSLLVAAQTALAVLLLAGNGLMIRSFAALLRVDLGYLVDRRLALTAHLWDLYPQPERRAEFFADVDRRLAEQHDVLAAGAASALPLSHEGSEMDPPFVVAGRPQPAPGDEPTALVTFVTPGYFKAVGMRLVQGRSFTDRDTPATTPVVVVNETMARRIWPGENPIGQRITSRLSFAGSATREVVGVVGDVRQGGLQDRPQPAYYVPHRQVPFGSMTMVVRTSGAAAAAVATVQRTIWSINPRVTFDGVETLDGLLRDTLAPRRFTLTLLSGFSAGALLLALVGLYGLTSFGVHHRTTEIGIRMTLGARAASVQALVMRDGLRSAWWGLIVGIGASLILTRYVSGLLFGVTPTDPVTFAALALAMLAVTALACYLPARRASRLDPLRAIRVE